MKDLNDPEKRFKNNKSPSKKEQFADWLSNENQ
jgi:hypothetical protein